MEVERSYNIAGKTQPLLLRYVYIKYDTDVYPARFVASQANPHISAKRGLVEVFMLGTIVLWYNELMINQNFVILGAIIAAIGCLSYLIDTVKGKVKPNRVSFLVWSLAPLIAFVAEIKQGVGLQSLMTFVIGFLPLTIFIASFFNKKAVWKLTRFDLTCGAFSIIGLVLWYITKSGNIAIIFSILADGLAALPTIVKSFNFPETESGWPYFSATISAAITLLTVKVWDLANVGFPIYVLIVTLVISALVQFKLGKVFHSYFN